MEPSVLQKKTEVFLNKIYPLLKNFPVAEKFCLCQEIKQACYRAIKNTMIYSSLKTQEKVSYLRMVDADLKLLLVLFGIARDQKYITKKKALELQENISELGRITGGLMKSVYAPK
jgi:four helix bundle protein